MSLRGSLRILCGLAALVGCDGVGRAIVADSSSGVGAGRPDCKRVRPECELPAAVVVHSASAPRETSLSPCQWDAQSATPRPGAQLSDCELRLAAKTDQSELQRAVLRNVRIVLRQGRAGRNTLLWLDLENHKADERWRADKQCSKLVHGLGLCLDRAATGNAQCTQSLRQAALSLGDALCIVR